MCRRDCLSCSGEVVSVCLCVCSDGGRSRKEGGAAFPCSWGEWEKPLYRRARIIKEFQQCFPCMSYCSHWSVITLHKQGKNAWEQKRGSFHARDLLLHQKGEIERQGEKGIQRECGTLSELIDLLKAPGQRERQASLMMVVIMFPMDLIQNQTAPYRASTSS